MKITRKQLLRIIKEEINNKIKIYTSTIIYFWPGLYPNSDKHSVQKYLTSRLGADATVEIIDGHMFARYNGDTLFVVPANYAVSFSTVDKLINERVEVTHGPNIKRYLAGYSAGSAGVVSAQKSSVIFDYTILADPTPISGAKFDELNYNPSNWTAYSSYSNTMEAMIKNNPGKLINKTSKRHEQYMYDAVDTLISRA